jgi:hypothetical protein
MPETRGKPPPTPHPDQPRRADSIRPEGPAPARTPHSTPRPDDDPSDSVYDSVQDDLNRVLSEPVSEPDPALASSPSPDPASLPPREDASVPSFLREKGKQPKTAEIFKSMGSASQTAPPRIRQGDSVLDSPAGSTPMPDEVFGSLEQGTSNDHPGVLGSGSDDGEQLADARNTWFFLLLLSYSSAITLALAWVLWTGRSFQRSEMPVANTSQGAEEPGSKPAESTRGEPLPPIPPANITTLQKTIRIGDVEVTPLEIDFTPVELIRKFDTDDYRHDYRREEASSLILKLRLTNVSTDHQFAPLDRLLIRDQNSPLDRTYIATADSGKIGLFPLAVDTEWSIPGQIFPVLKNREPVDTVLASEPVTEDRLQGELTWRIRLRVGPYRTDLLGVRFSKSDLGAHE